jgi:hypothetical protein
MWRCRHNCFRADGAYGQYIIVMPDQDAVIAITAETGDMQDELNLIWEYLLPSIKTGTLPENKALAASLKQKLSSLALPLPAAKSNSSLAAGNSGKTYAFGTNEKHTITFQFPDNTCKVSMMIDTARYNFSFGSGQWITGVTTLHGPNLLLQAKAHFVGLPPSKVAGSYTWKDENTLELVLRFNESPHTETIICRFDKKNISVGFHYSNEPNNIQPELKGAIIE